MTKHYYKILSVFGIICAFGLAFGLMGNYIISLFSIHEKFNGLVPILLGIGSILITSFFIDLRKNKRSEEISFWKGAVIFPVLIYFSGVFIGSIFNCLLNAQNLLEVMDYLKPSYFLILFGFPSAVIVGIITFAVHKGYLGNSDFTNH